MDNNQTESQMEDLAVSEILTEIEKAFQTISDNEELGKYEMIEAFQELAVEMKLYQIAQHILYVYEETKSEEDLATYRKLYEIVTSYGAISEIAPFFDFIPLTFIQEYEDDRFPEFLKVITHVELDGNERPLKEVFEKLADASNITNKFVEYFNELPSKIAKADEEKITITELFNKEVTRWHSKQKIEQHEAYEGFDGFIALPLDTAKKFVRKLEDLIKDLEDQEVYKKDAAPIVLALLEQGNYDLLISDLFMCIENTDGMKYFNLIKRIFKCIQWVDCEEDAFDQFLWSKAKHLVTTSSPVHVEIFKNEVTTELEFNGKKMAIEEYLELSKKVQEMNDMLIGSLFFNAEARHAVETGTATPTEIFAKKIKEMSN